MTEDPIGTALRELVPEPPVELTMGRLVAARSHRRRRTGLVVGTAVLAVLAMVVPVTVAVRAGRPAPTASSAEPVVTDTLGAVTVTHPARWAFRPTERIFSTGSEFDGYLSTEPIPYRLCRTTKDSTGTEIDCPAPSPRLGPDGALLAFIRPDLPGVSLEHEPGVATTVAGRPAKVVRTPGGAGCGTTGADLRVETVIRFAGTVPQKENLLYVSACLRGPHLTRSEAELTALLASIRWTG